MNNLNECHDLSMNINWPQINNIQTTSTYILCIIASINASVTSDSATNNMNMLNVFDIDLSDRYQLTPIKLSIDEISKDESEERRRLQDDSSNTNICNSISFNTYAISPIIFLLSSLITCYHGRPISQQHPLPHHDHFHQLLFQIGSSLA
eukprot:469195_1